MIGLSTVLVNIVMWYQLLYKYLSLLSSVGAANYLAIYLHLIYHYVLGRELQCSLNELQQQRFNAYGCISGLYRSKSHLSL